MSVFARAAKHWKALALLSIPGAVLFALVFVLATNSGRDLVLNYAVAQMPADMQLSIEDAQGTFWSGVGAARVRIMSPDQHLELNGVSSRISLSAALRGIVDFRQLRIEQVHISLLSEPAQQMNPSGWVADIRSATEVRLHDAQINQLTVSRAGETPTHIQSIRFSGRIHSDGVEISTLSADTGQGALAVSGRYATHSQMDIALEGAVRSEARQIAFQVRGQDDRIVFHIEDPDQGMFISGALRDVRGDANISAQLGWQPPAVSGSVVERAQLHVHWQDGIWSSSGWAKWNQELWLIDLPYLRWAGDTIELRQSFLRARTATVHASGEIDLSTTQAQANLDIALTNVCLIAANNNRPWCVNGRFELRGFADDWRASGSASASQAARRLHLELDAVGDREHAQLNRIALTQDGRQSSGSGTVNWSETLRWNLQLDLRQFDPSVFLNNWPARLSGVIYTQGEVEESLATYTLRSPGLSGTLLDKPIQAKGQFEHLGNHQLFDVELSSKASRAKAKGRWGNAKQIDLLFENFSLQDVMPDAKGRLGGSLIVSQSRGELSFASSLQAKDLRWGDWSAQSVDLSGALDANSDKGEFTLAFDQLNHGEWQSRSGTIELRGSTNNARLAVQADSDLGTIAAAASFRWQAPRALLELSALRIDTTDYGPISLVAASTLVYHEQTGISARDLCVRAAAGQLCVEQLNSKNINISAQISDAQILSPLIRQLDDVPLVLSGNLSMAARALHTARGWAWQSQWRSEQLVLAHERAAGIALSQINRLQLNLESGHGSFGAKWTSDLDETGFFNGDVVWDEQRIDAQAQLQTSQLLWLELLSPDLAQPQGQLSANLRVSGSPDYPDVQGNLRLSELQAELPALGLSLSQGQMVIESTDKQRARVVGSIQSGDGELTFLGELNWRDELSPMALEIRGEHVRIADTVDLQMWATPSLQISGNMQHVTIRGDVLIPEAQLELERLSLATVSSDDVIVLGAEDESRQSMTADVGVTVRLGDKVRLRGFGLNAKMQGQLAIIDKPNFAATGRGSLQLDGVYRAYGQRLEIKSGTLRYSGGELDNPSLNILAQRERDIGQVGLRVRGSALNPQTLLWSDPAMPDADVLSWLILGQPLSAVGGDEAKQLGSVMESLGASSAITQNIGARLGLDNAAIVHSRALGGTSLSVGKYLSPRLFVGYGLSLIGNGQVAWLRYRLSKQIEAELEAGDEQRLRLLWKRER